MSAALARPKLTKAQIAALDALANDQQATFVLAYVGEAAGNATKAAEIAEYAHPGQQGHRLLKDVEIQAAIALFRIPAIERKYRDAEQLKEWWDKGIDNEDWEAKDRIKCSDSLARAQGVYVERHQVEVVNVPTNRSELRARLEQMVAAEGGHVVWDEAVLTEGSDDDGS